MAVDQAGQDRHITQINFLHISWRVLANVCDRPDLLDAVSLDPDPAILEDLARLHVHQARGPDQRRLRGLLRLLGIRVGEQCQRSRRYRQNMVARRRIVHEFIIVESPVIWAGQDDSV